MSPTRRIFPVLGLLAMLSLGCAGGTADAGAQPLPGDPMSERDPGDAQAWKRIDRLIREQKMRQALEQVEPLIASARARDDANGWTRALVKAVQLRIALHGYETAVRFLRTTAWPQDDVSRVILDLFYAHALVRYRDAYGFDIAGRDTVVGVETVDLAVWTGAQIAAEINRAFARAWHGRRALGQRSLGRLAAYVEQNGYPARIRGTTRDTLSYLWAEVLVDSSTWSPAEAHAVERLDFDALLAGQPHLEVPLEAALTRAEVHPLVKLAIVLGDLEAWHRAGERPEAAFEAYRQRLLALTAHARNASDRARLSSGLEARLEALGRQYPWWSMGMAARADLARDSTGHEHLIAAFQLATEGAQAFPESLGGRRCRALADTIEAPWFQLAGMAVDGPGRRSLGVTYKNLPALFLRAYHLPLETLLAQPSLGRGLIAPRTIATWTAGREPDAAWRQALAPTPDFSNHRSDLRLPLETAGPVLVLASARADFGDDDNQVQALVLQISALVTLTRRLAGDRVSVTVRLGDDGTPVAGATVSLLRLERGSPATQVAAATTDAAGTVELTVPARVSWVLLARHGDAVVLDGRAAQGPRPRRQRPQQPATLIYTDRAIYRPGQEILWKTVTYGPERETEDGDTRDGATREAHALEIPHRFRLRAHQTLSVALRDANGEVVDTVEVKSNAFGSATGRFQVPRGRLLGAWSLRATWNGQAKIRVEAYRRPTFEVALEDPSPPLALGREATLVGRANYHFGLPVTEGTVVWRVVRASDIRPLPGRLFASWWPAPGPPEVVAAGRTNLDDQGRFQVCFAPRGGLPQDARPGQPPSDRRYHFRLEAEVTDAGGETRSVQRGFTVGTVGVEATFGTLPGFVTAGTALEVEVLRRDLDGRPQPGHGIWQLLRVVQPAETLLPAEQALPQVPDDAAPFLSDDDRRRPRWQPGYHPRRIVATWADGEVIAEGTATHGDDGRASLSLSALPAGLMRLRYRTEDDAGAAFETSAELLVAGPAARLALPAALLVEHPRVAPGEHARVLVASGRNGQAMVFEAWRGPQRLLRRTLRGGRPEVIELPVTAADRGGLTLGLVSVADYQLMALEERVDVPWQDRELEIRFATFRDRLRPGDTEHWRIDVHGPDGALEAGTVELLASMYDQSLDRLAPHTPPHLLGLLYPRRASSPALSSVLAPALVIHAGGRGFQRVVLEALPAADRLRFLDGYAIGGPGRFGRAADGVMRTLGVTKSRATRGAAPESAPMAASVTLDQAAADTAPGIAPPPDETDTQALGADPIRSNFAETAFWQPQLLLDGDSGVSVSFTAPEAVTAWTVWVEALTRDLRAGSARTTVRTARALLVRPQVPRFLREGDRARIAVLVQNTGADRLEGRLEVDLIDPDTGRSRGRDFGLADGGLRDLPFDLAGGASTSIEVLVQAPAAIGPAALRAVGHAGDLSDGELRPLPVLPGRMHLATSRFTAVAPGAQGSLAWDPPGEDDPSRVDEQLVVQVDGQLLLSVLEAVPYLLDYPYPSIPATVERFVAAGTLAGLLDSHPPLAAAARTLAAKRKTPLPRFDRDDPNRNVALVETPWLVAAQGGEKNPWWLLPLLEPGVAARTRDSALDELRRSQRSDGGWPWFPGGPPSPTITLQTLFGLAKALDLGVASLPEDGIQRAWAYLDHHWRETQAARPHDEDCCWETATFFVYVLTRYPDVERWTGGVLTEDDRDRLLDLAWRHWHQTSPLLKVYLAMALARAGRDAQAGLVLDSVLDSARTDPVLGTFWQPEARAWQFYNDTLVGHATVLRALDELRPQDPHRQGLMRWLLLNKQLNHWRSTRATAEVLYTLVRSQLRSDLPAAPGAAWVRAGAKKKHFVFTPESYLAHDNQLVIEGADIDPEGMRSIEVMNQGKKPIFAHATWHYATDRPPATGDGDLFHLKRALFRRTTRAGGVSLEPLGPNASLRVGDSVEVQLTITSRANAEYVQVRDPRPAGLEPETQRSGYRFEGSVAWYQQVGESGSDLFFESLPAGTVTVRYRLRARLAGRFKAAPATIQSVYAPAFAGHTSGGVLDIGRRQPAPEAQP